MPSENPKGREDLREAIMGFGEKSVRKSYYPQLRETFHKLQRFKALLDHTRDFIFLVDVNGKIVDVNKSSLQKLGYSKEDISSIFEIIPTEYNDNFRELLSKKEASMEMPLLKGDGGLILTEMNLNIVKFNGDNYAVIVARDIIGRKKLEEELRKSLEEKEILLKEMHHRSKNNLQIISSLLNLQAMTTDAKKETFKETQDRIKSMALIHEQLYQSEDLARINFKEYAEKLIKNLLNSYPMGKSVTTKLDIENITLEVDTAIPLGLIMNELLTNTLKYAFFGKDKGTIEVTFKRLKDNLELKIADDGIGFPEDKLHESKSLGLKLVNVLVRQLEGRLSVKSQNGSCFKIIFKG
ncbi:MAG TPA: histidine kinase dimerization/phosphoacceptor domain -containing protein [Methanothermobacter sp.]|nr:sensory transduction histidine kinase [Methanothermobacter sp. MT-2]HHW05397.1 PAS domain S-box protein [Methanothermobacter sp.]HOK73152.1 histidine kinase dimerization/phosphoacceptor domain -containing protein [Methanothermobacter sp.]HOL68784.1 histidine kinase dimerization/phosphoacceptor domain -containing protein [Methanothermobacter sp.]HPQ04677.1 histidine kinase dimerization/phosphoacceptor domain -containing protein [Methanothermobacter sp.]